MPKEAQTKKEKQQQTCTEGMLQNVFYFADELAKKVIEILRAIAQRMTDA